MIMKKLLLTGAILLGSIGISTANCPPPVEVIRFCWQNSCNQWYCGLYYSDEEPGTLFDDYIMSEVDCVMQILWAMDVLEDY